MRRREKEQDANFALDVIKNAYFSTLAMVGTDGKPYCVPLQHVLVDNVIYFHCALKGQKIDFLLMNPNVCMSFVLEATTLAEKFSTAYKSAIVTGTAFEVMLEEQKTAVLSALCQKYTLEQMDVVPAQITKFIRVTKVMGIKITAVTGKSSV